MTARRIAWAIWGLTAALLISWPFLAEAARTPDSDALAYVPLSLAVMGYATVGALITSRRAGNRIGLLLSLIGLSVALTLAMGSYAKLAFDRGVSLPLPAAAAWLGHAGFPLWLAPMPLIFLLFPTGSVPGRRWRWLLWLMLAAITVAVALYAVTPGLVDAGFAELETRVMNPVALPTTWKSPIENVTTAAGLVAFVGSFLCVLSLVIRYRRAAGEERQQIRWLVYVAAVAAAIPLAGLVIAGIRELLGHDVGDEDFLGNAMFLAFFVILLIGVPAACAVAILRYRLYQLDVVVKKTVVFALVAAFITAVYALLVFVVPLAVFGVGQGESGVDVITLVSTVLVAALFNPVRVRARRLADRFVYGKRATPYEVLSEFSDRIAESYSSDDVLPRIATLLGSSTGATVARVWLRLGPELVPVAAWPIEAPPAAAMAMSGNELPAMDGDRFPVRHQGELLGAFTLEMPANDPMNPSKEKLASDLAAQAGLVLRNVRLIEELRASRRRIVEAQDERAKKLERNIHDGAQQQLVALQVKQRLIEGMLERDPAGAKELLAQLQVDTGSALDDLRDLARGIYPPLLADKGLAAALEAQARRSPVPVAVEPDGVGRLSREVESAVYFCVLEALQNMAKYARASQATVALSHENGELTFSVVDDGQGFDPSATGHGTGLQGMADRLDALGGGLRIESAPGRGTTISGTVPASMEGPP